MPYRDMTMKAAHARRWHADNREDRLARMREYQQDNSEAINARKRANYAKNREQTIAAAEIRRARGRVIIDAHKATGCCICGFDVAPALDFHHRDPATKERTVASMTLLTEERILAEIAKCVVLCANHHRMFHAGLIDLPESVV